MIWYYAVSASISLISLFVNIVIFQKNKKLTLKTKYNSNVFDEYLIDIIPDVYNDFVSNDEFSLSKSEEFQTVLGALRKRIVLFKFYNLKFYELIDGIIIEIDDKVTLLSDECDNKEELKDELDNLLKRMYSKIEKNYIGK